MKKRPYLFFLLFFAAFAAVSAPAADLEDTLYEILETELSGPTLRYFYKHYDIHEDERLTSIANDLNEVTKNQRGRTIGIIKKDEVNAFSMAGGHILFFEGLLDFVKSPHETACVVAHEMGHVEKRHSLKHFILIMGLDALTRSVYSRNQEEMNWLRSQYIAYLASMGFSREEEMEADNLAMQYMSDAGYNPAACIDFLTRIQEYEKKHKVVFTIESSHPPTGKRIENMKRWLTENGNAYEGTFTTEQMTKKWLNDKQDPWKGYKPGETNLEKWATEKSRKDNTPAAKKRKYESVDAELLSESAAMLREGKYLNAVAYSKKAVKCEERAGCDQKRYAEAMGVRGEGYFALGEFGKAVESYIEASAAAPEAHQYEVLLAEAYVAAKDKKNAETLIDKAAGFSGELKGFDTDLSALRTIRAGLAENGEFPAKKDLLEQASLYFDSGRNADAAIFFLARLLLDPANAEANYNLALCYENMGDKERAVKFYYRYLYNAPDANDKKQILKVIGELTGAAAGR